MSLFDIIQTVVPGGRLSCDYGLRKAPIRGVKQSWQREFLRDILEFHGGIDISAPLGTPILMKGFPFALLTAGENHPIYGNFAVFETSDKYIINCWHLQNPIQNFNLLRVGSSGASTGPHLHFQVRSKNMPAGTHIDPIYWLDSYVNKSSIPTPGINQRIDNIGKQKKIWELLA